MLDLSEGVGLHVFYYVRMPWCELNTILWDMQTTLSHLWQQLYSSFAKLKRYAKDTLKLQIEVNSDQP